MATGEAVTSLRCRRATPPDLPDLSRLQVSPTQPGFRTDPIKLRLLLYGAEDRTALTEVSIDARTLRETGPIAVEPRLGKGRVQLVFVAGLDDKHAIENIAHFDFAHATGKIWKFDPETNERTLWTEKVELESYSLLRDVRDLRGLRDGGTELFYVKFTWPQDGSKNAGRSGYVSVTPDPPVVELVLEIPLR